MEINMKERTEEQWRRYERARAIKIQNNSFKRGKYMSFAEATREAKKVDDEEDK